MMALVGLRLGGIRWVGEPIACRLCARFLIPRVAFGWRSSPALTQANGFHRYAVPEPSAAIVCDSLLRRAADKNKEESTWPTVRLQP